MSERNIVAWNTMISTYIENQCIKEGLQLFMQMGENGISPDEYTIAIMIKAMIVQSEIAECKQFHVIAVKSGYYTDAPIGNALITMYAEFCGMVRKIFLYTVEEVKRLSPKAKLPTVGNEMKLSKPDSDVGVGTEDQSSVVGPGF